MSEESKHEQAASGLRKVLNSHGHGFHYAVLRRAAELASSGHSHWTFDGAEFPVVAGGTTTHIDFILRSHSRRTTLVAECKRADPSRARWCFARAPYTLRNPREGEVIFDQFVCAPANILTQSPCVSYTSRGIYHLGHELKTGLPGDGAAQSTSAINQAVSQVLRGTSGLVNHLFEFSRRSYREERVARFIPVVFTTAEIFVTDADLGAADVSTGELPVDSVTAEPAGWVWFNHNRSPALRHDLEWELPSDDLSKELRHEFTRSIAIVSPIGIDEFLTSNLEGWLD